MHLAADAIPLGLCITEQGVSQLLLCLGDCLFVSLMKILEHLFGLLNLHLGGLNVDVHSDSALRSRGFKEILQHARLPSNSLGKLPTLCAQPFLVDDTEDCNYVCKVFLGVTTGVYGHVEVGIVWKLDHEGLRFFLGRDNIRQRYVRDGWPVAQLPFLALGIL
jgi:hypothetical protein